MTTEPRTVEIQVIFNRIGTIDVMSELYQAEVHIFAEWKEYQELTSYNPEKMWNPKLFIKNCTVVNKDEAKHTVKVISPGVTLISEKRIIKGTFWEKLELNSFPFDIQELSVEVAAKINKDTVRIMENPNRKSHIDFYANDAFVEQQKWILYKFLDVKKEKEDMDAKSTINQYENIFVSLFVSRKAGYYIFNAFLLIFLINSMALTIFAVDCKLVQNRLTINLTLLLTSVMLKWNTNRSLPPISYLTHLDYYSIISIILLCLYIAWHAIVGSQWEKSRAVVIDFWVFVGFASIHAAYNLFYVCWVFVCLRNLKKLREKEAQFLKELSAFLV